MSREEIDQSNNVLQTVLHQLAKAQATRDLAKLDLAYRYPRPVRWLGDQLNVYAGEFITRGSTAVALGNRTPSTSSPIWKRPSWKACVRAIAPKSRRSAATGS